ncbi:uncharacterized protein LOC144450196 isoform X2 [Glandiceps talaboti]
MAAAATLARTSRRKNDLELMMECDDDELSPTQRDQYQRQLQALRNHHQLVENYKNEKARREEQERLRKLEEKKALMVSQARATQIINPPMSKSGNVYNIQNASGIVQNIAKQLGNTRSPNNLISSQPVMSSQYRQDGSTNYVPSNVNPNAMTLQRSPPSQTVTSVIPSYSISQPITPVSAMPTQQFYIQKPAVSMNPPKPASTTLTGVSAGQMVQVHQSPPAGSTASHSPRQVQIESGPNAKSNVKTTVIRVPTGINIQQHLGTNYKLLTSTGNVYHYVYSPVTTTAAMVQAPKPTQTYQQVVQPPPRAPSPPVYRSQPAASKVSPSYPASITDILLGKRPNQTESRPSRSSQPKRLQISAPVETAPSKKFKSVVEEPVRVAEEPAKVKEPKYSIDQFYGSKEGSRNYLDDKYKYGFKCYHCTKLISNNIKYMAHIKNHLDKEKQENLTLNDIINCDHCGRRFNTPFELQCHIEKSHISSSDLRCRICDLTLDCKSDLMSHMTSKHPPLQMPYSCPICQFRSSFLDTTIEHFKAKHEGIKKCLCTHCLKASGDANSYLRHCQKHQTKSGNVRCKKCKLMFVTSADLKAHDTNDHIRFPVKIKRKAVHEPKEDLEEPVVETTPATATVQTNSYSEYRKKRKQVKGDARKGTLESYSLNDWKAAFDKSRKNEVHRCSECGTVISSLAAHFATFLKCSHCHYRTYCGLSYSNHMIKFHRTTSSSPQLHPVSKMSGAVLKCMRCSFMTESGSAMAGHVMTCINGPTEVEGFKHHTRPRRQDELSASSSSSNSPIPKQDTFDKVNYESEDPLLDDVSTDNIHASVSNIIDRLFGADEEESNFVQGDEQLTAQEQPAKVSDKDNDNVVSLVQKFENSTEDNPSMDNSSRHKRGDRKNEVKEEVTVVKDEAEDNTAIFEGKEEITDDQKKTTTPTEGITSSKDVKELKSDVDDNKGLAEEYDSESKVQNEDEGKESGTNDDDEDSVSVKEDETKEDDGDEDTTDVKMSVDGSRSDDAQKDNSEESDESFTTAPDRSPVIQEDVDKEETIADGGVDSNHEEGESIADGGVDSNHEEGETIADGGVDSNHEEGESIADGGVDSNHEEGDAIADDGVDSNHEEGETIADGGVDSNHEEGDAIEDGKGVDSQEEGDTTVDKGDSSHQEGDAFEDDKGTSSHEEETVEDIKEAEKEEGDSESCTHQDDDIDEALLAKDDDSDEQLLAEDEVCNDDQLLAEDDDGKDDQLLAEDDDVGNEDQLLAEDDGVGNDKQSMAKSDEEVDNDESSLARGDEEVDNDESSLARGDEEVDNDESSFAGEDDNVIPDGASIEFEDGESSRDGQDFVIMDEWSDGQEDSEEKNENDDDDDMKKDS